MSDTLAKAFEAAAGKHGPGCLECGGVRSDGQYLWMSARRREEIPRCSSCKAYLHPNGTALGKLMPNGQVLLKLIILRPEDPSTYPHEVIWL